MNLKNRLKAKIKASVNDVKRGWAAKNAEDARLKKMYNEKLSVEKEKQYKVVMLKKAKLEAKVDANRRFGVRKAPVVGMTTRVNMDKGFSQTKKGKSKKKKNYDNLIWDS